MSAPSPVSCPRCGQTVLAWITTCPFCGLAVVPPRPDDASLAPPPPPPPPPAIPYPFFPVATHKLIVMSLCTFGLYQIYWSYQNWRRIRDQRGDPVSPFWRAFFAGIWNFALFGEIRDAADQNGLPFGWNSIVMGVGYIVLNGVWRLPDPWSFFGFAAVLVLVPVNRTAQQVNERVSPGSHESRNTSYRGWNWLGLVLGGFLVLMAIVGLIVGPN